METTNLCSHVSQDGLFSNAWRCRILNGIVFYTACHEDESRSNWWGCNSSCSAVFCFAISEHVVFKILMIYLFTADILLCCTVFWQFCGYCVIFFVLPSDFVEFYDVMGFSLTRRPATWWYLVILDYKDVLSYRVMVFCHLAQLYCVL